MVSGKGEANSKMLVCNRVIQVGTGICKDSVRNVSKRNKTILELYTFRVIYISLGDFVMNS